MIALILLVLFLQVVILVGLCIWKDNSTLDDCFYQGMEDLRRTIIERDDKIRAQEAKVVALKAELNLKTSQAETAYRNEAAVVWQLDMIRGVLKGEGRVDCNAGET